MTDAVTNDVFLKARGKRHIDTSKAIDYAKSIFKFYFETEEMHKTISAIALKCEKRYKVVLSMVENLRDHFQGGEDNHARMYGSFEDTGVVKGILKVFGRLADLIEMSDQLQPVDWDEEIPGLNRTRREERKSILRDNPEIADSLGQWFDDIDAFLRGEPITVEPLVLIGGAGTGKTWLKQRILKMFGRDYISLSHDEFTEEKNIKGPVGLRNLWGETDKDEREIWGIVPYAAIKASQKGSFITLDDVEWEDGDNIDGIESSDAALEFLNPATDEIPLRFLAERVEDAPSMSCRAIFKIITTNAIIPRELAEIRDGVRAIYMPDANVERKIAWTQLSTESSKSLPEELWKSAQRFLPFAAGADTYAIPGRQGVRDVQKAYDRIITIIEQTPDIAEQDVKAEILGVLAPGMKLDVSEVEKTIAERHESIIEAKLRSAKSRLQDGTLSADTQDRIRTYLPVACRLDTTMFHRGEQSAELVLDALQRALKKETRVLPRTAQTKLIGLPAIANDDVGEYVYRLMNIENERLRIITEELGQGYPLLPYRTPQSFEASMLSWNDIDPELRDFPFELNQLFRKLESEAGKRKDKSSSIFGILQDFANTASGHAMLVAGLNFAVFLLFPSFSKNEGVAMIIHSLNTALVDFGLGRKEDFDDEKSSKSRQSAGMKKWEFIYQNLLDSEKANEYIESLPDKNLRETINQFKTLVSQVVRGETSYWNYNRIQLAEMPIMISRVKRYLQLPQYIRQIDWNEVIPGERITRGQRRDEMPRRWSQYASALRAFFTAIDRNTRGEDNAQPRFVVTGGSESDHIRLFDEIEEVLGLGTVKLSAKDLVSKMALFGPAHSPFSRPGQGWKFDSEEELFGKLPAALFGKPWGNIVIRIERVDWKLICHSDVARRFLDPDPFGMLDELTGLSISSHMGGILRRRAHMPLLISSPHHIPEGREYAPIRSRLLEIKSPLMTIEMKIRSSANALSMLSGIKSGGAEWERCRKFLPFIIFADTFYTETNSETKIIQVCKSVIEILRKGPDISDESLKTAIIDRLAAGSMEEEPLSLEEVEKLIFKGQKEIIKQKIQWAENALKGKEKSESVPAEAMKRLVRDMAMVDTVVMCRSGTDRMKVPLDQAIALLSKGAEEKQVSQNILAEVAGDSPLPIDSEGLLQALENYRSKTKEERGKEKLPTMTDYLVGA